MTMMIPGFPLPVGGFDYAPRTRLLFGRGLLSRVGDLAKELGGRRVLVVTDPGLVRAGHADRVIDAMSQSGLAVSCYDQVRENPTTADVARCLESAKAHGADLFVGLGGGSSMDTAKGCNFILTNGGEMRDYWGVGKAKLPMLPLIAVPTTSGTGSECQSAALIADEKSHQKMACLDPKAAARVALLDPELTLSLPQRVTSVTGIDAIAHALETWVTTKRNPISSLYSEAAAKLLFSAFPRVLSAPGDVEARGDMLLGAAFAGTAIENSMLGCAHSAANPLTAHHDVVHGQAVGMLLPWVIRFNGGWAEVADRYRGLAVALKGSDDFESSTQATEWLASTVESLMVRAELPLKLSACGVARTDVPALAAEAKRQWTAQFNPRPVEEPEFAELYRHIA